MKFYISNYYLDVLMQRIISIHRKLYNHTKRLYNFDISKINIKNTDNEKDILEKIDLLVHVQICPDEWYVLKHKALK